ncbi:glycosyl transferase family 1 [Chloroflexus islandicus]|uniref:Glycosyl transferase family 1 n=1 Tax=Chloroflexus islandicus TaxID=1707952 RepID=A0A178MEX1_9CHLR|nr:glycosyltransferase [Chloroflexus islandicus]OAN47320.1 glycosyl transferase family 1 [Chloroflexus islandicus]
MDKTIVVFCNQPISISETFVYNQIAGLTRYRPAILGTKLPPEPRIHLNNLEVSLLNQGGLRGRLRELELKLLGRVPPDIQRWIASQRPALIHAHFVPYGAIALPIAQQFQRPLLVSAHGTDVTLRDFAIWRSSYLAHRLYLLRRKQLVRHTSRLIVQSHFLRQIAINQHGFKPEQVACIRYGIDLSQFQAHQHPPEAGHILYVGRLVERKGLPFLLEALAQLQPRFPDLHLTVIGDGPMRARYEALARQYLGDRVTFLGAQPSATVRSYLQRAYAFCMPSITMPSGEAETLGVVFLEAMAMRVPPVSFASGGIPEVIRHGETGFLATERNPTELAHYLGLLLANPALRERMGEQGRRWVEQEFNLTTQNAKLEALYDEVLAEHHQLQAH